MKTLSKIVFLTSLSFIGGCIFIGILGSLLPIEVIDDNLVYYYMVIRFYGIPITIILTLTGTIKQKDKAGLIIGKIIATIAMSIFSLFIVFMVLFSNMCGWTTNRVFFENTQNKTIKIVERNFGCGATDSGEPVYKIFKLKEITKYFIWVTEIDTNQIDKSEWTRINNKTE